MVIENSSFDKKDRVRLKGILRRKPLLGPRSVNLHLTNVCDRRCIFCWYYSPLVSRTCKAQHLEFDKARILLNDCRVMGVRTINVEGGEINLYPRIKDFFALAKSLDFRLECYSHLAFGRAALGYLKDADLIRVNLSASDQKSYRIMHGKSGFDQVIENLARLRAFKKERGLPEISLSFIITESNFDLLEHFFNLADKLRVDRVTCKLLSATQEMKSLILSEPSRMRLKDILFRLLKKEIPFRNNLKKIAQIIAAADFLKNKRAMNWGIRHNDRLFYYSAWRGWKARCFVGWFYAFIDERGRVIAPCDNVGFCVPGNINRQSFRDIWFDAPQYAKMRQEAMTQIDISKDKWLECRYCGNVDFNEEVLQALGKMRHDPRIA
jgi:MoaA/NifB/PqqE/SkfB family radical SAM enzyme